MSMQRRSVVVALATAGFALAFVAVTKGAPSLNLSGYEFLLGTPCEIGGLPGTCGVQFGGWTGGTGFGATGWTTFPGNRRGLWAAAINYTGSAGFGKQVDVAGGNYDVLFKHAKTVSGTVVGGTVSWPAEGGDDGCGTGVATVSLTLSGDASSFHGCLHDLPAGSIIPPRIWGTLY